MRVLSALEINFIVTHVLIVLLFTIISDSFTIFTLKLININLSFKRILAYNKFAN